MWEAIDLLKLYVFMVSNQKTMDGIDYKHEFGKERILLDERKEKRDFLSSRSMLYSRMNLVWNAWGN